MDFGFFRRDRLHFWVWLLMPVLLVVALGLGSRTWFRRYEQGLARRQWAMEVIPGYRRQIEQARATVRAVKGIADASVLCDAEDLRTALNRFAHECGFDIFALKINRLEPDENNGLVAPCHRVQLAGQGVPEAVIQYLDFLQRPAHLVHLESAHLALSGENDGRRYVSEMHFLWYGRASGDASTGPVNDVGGRS